MREDHSTKSAGGLVQDAMSNVSALVRNEVDLARAEINENLTKAGVAAGMIAAGAIVVLVALNVLAAALVAALTEAGLDGGWAALIVGVVLAVIAYVMIQKGMNDLAFKPRTHADGEECAPRRRSRKGCL